MHQGGAFELWVKTLLYISIDLLHELQSGQVEARGTQSWALASRY